jgi:exodeoxyribonuclease VII small subunit
MKESEKYSTMLKQVETIVNDISTSDIDLDLMVEKVETGYELIKKMRSRLQETKVKIEELRSDFDASQES